MTAISSDGVFGGLRAAPVGDQLTERIRRRFADEESDGRRLAARGRAVALCAIAVLLVFLTPFPGVLYYHALLALFLLLGYANIWLQRAGLAAWWHIYALTALDFALLTFTLIYPNPVAAVHLPPQMWLRYGNFVYFYVMLAGLAFSYRPLLMLWGGLMGAAFWILGVLWLASLPGSINAQTSNADPAIALTTILDPQFIDWGVRLQEVIVFLIVASLLAVIVLRSRRLVLSQAVLERERSNLARYFSPATVEQLAGQDTPFTHIRDQDAAVLFADVVGFTTWAEGRQPGEVIGLLREVHSRIEDAVFDHHGTFDKFIGDGAMATFGTPQPGPEDAANALACVTAILDSFDRWNDDRARQNQEPVRIALGLHFGPVVIGDVGSERRLELAVLGDTVNVASRLERMTRELGCRALVSEAVVDTARSQAPDAAEHLLERYTQSGAASVRGRQAEVAVWAA